MNVVVFKDQHSSWVAQCLEFDIAAQGKTLQDAQKAFERVLMSQVMLDVYHQRPPFEGIGQAPKEYWEMLERAEQ